MAAKKAENRKNDHFGANLRHVTEELIYSTSKYQKNILTDDENYHGTQYIKRVCICLR